MVGATKHFSGKILAPHHPSYSPSYSVSHNVLERESRYTLGLNAAKNIGGIKKYFK